MVALRRGTFLTYHSQLASVNTEYNTWVVFYNSDELQLWFRQGQLTIESSDSDLDKVLVTYSQVESNQFEFPHVDSNYMWIFKPLYFIVINLSNYSLINEKHSQLQAIFALFHSWITK